MLEEGIASTNQPLPAMKNPTYLSRAANRYQQKLRPDEPSDLNFELNEDHTPPDFLKADIHTDERRHIVFATENMLSLLTRSKTWYIDGTFKVVKTPFFQLLSIHSFIRSGEFVKQVPLAFVMMSGKRKRDYVKVLKSIMGMTNGRRVEKVGLDF